VKHNYINDDIEIDFYVPDCLKNLMLDAEQADKDEDLGYYLMLADSIDVWAKNYYADGVITSKQWDLINMRFPQ